MSKMTKEEETQLFNDHPHLKDYVEDFSQKAVRPTFYSKVPRDLKEDPEPNIIYPTKGVVFIHIYGKKDFDFTQYNSIEPKLSDETEKKK